MQEKRYPHMGRLKLHLQSEKPSPQAIEGGQGCPVVPRATQIGLCNLSATRVLPALWAEHHDDYTGHMPCEATRAEAEQKSPPVGRQAPACSFRLPGSIHTDVAGVSSHCLEDRRNLTPSHSKLSPRAKCIPTTLALSYKMLLSNRRQGRNQSRDTTPECPCHPTLDAGGHPDEA